MSERIATADLDSGERQAHAVAGLTVSDRVAARLVETRLVWSVWAAMALAALALVVRFGVDMPYSDDVGMLPQLTGKVPVTVAWLWAPANEHRIPLAKLAMVALARVSGVDFRAGMLAHLMVLAGASAFLLVQLSRLSGGLRLSDAVVPLAVLDLGHAENLLWQFTMPSVVSTALIVVILGLVVSDRPGFAALLTCLLPFLGSQALPTAGALAVWFVIVRRFGWAAAVGGATALVLLAGSDKPSWHPPLASLGDALWFSIHILGGGLTSSMEIWPIAAVCALALCGGALLVAGRVRGPVALGLAAVVAGGMATALAVGFGRAGFGIQQAHAIRYSLLMTPAVLAAYLVLRSTGRGRLAPRLAAGAIVAMLALNTTIGLDWARTQHLMLARARTDLETLPLGEFCDRQTPHIHQSRDFLCAMIEDYAAKARR